MYITILNKVHKKIVSDFYLTFHNVSRCFTIKKKELDGKVSEGASLLRVIGGSECQSLENSLASYELYNIHLDKQMNG